MFGFRIVLWFWVLWFWMLWLSVFWCLWMFDVFVGVHNVFVIERSRGNSRYLYSRLESSPGRDGKMQRPRSLPRLAKDFQRPLLCHLSLRSRISKWCMQECRLPSFNVHDTASELGASFVTCPQTTCQTQQALDDIFHFTDSFPPIFSTVKAIIW